MKSAQPLVLAFFSDIDGAPRALRGLRRDGLRRSAAVQCFETGSVRVIGNQFSRRRGMIVSGAVVVGLLEGYALIPFASSQGTVAQWVIGALLISTGIAVAWLIARRAIALWNQDRESFARTSSRL